MKYGALVYAQKERRYIGKSAVTYRASYRVCYVLYFFKEEDAKAQKGLTHYVSGIPFTKSISSNKKSEALKILKDNGYPLVEFMSR